ncbi:3D domain-containing protein [Acetonema longum]|uniref:3D domain protein n=1 Tax=Acetonema longum DSM 6540 TaxID=1009370 RepID=F7NJ13_9FIRM|nr:3D domain-containing protein [Acetonema longum]EGO64010.1 3D domain protein [Acetonema longum DSM 6540]
MRSKFLLAILCCLLAFTGISFAASEDKPLAAGDRGQAVQQLQQLLADTGFYPGWVDGVFGPATGEAVKKVQKAFNLPATGQADLKVLGKLKEASAKPDQYKQALTMNASAYTSQDPNTGNYTKRGHRLRHGLVAVDPTVIPLGTRLYIEDYGYAVADDIGSSIKGNKIDLAFENRREALIFGRRNIKVYIME